MSLVSIVKNAAEIDAEKKKLFEILKNCDNKEAIQYVIKSCLLKQYEMMRKYMNTNMINKRHFSRDLKGKDLIDALYQHIFSHNFIAFEDEVFEVFDAAKKRESVSTNNPIKAVEDYMLTEALVVEEVIDVFHFLLEYIILSEELNTIILDTDIDSLTVDDLDRLYVNCDADNTFYENVKLMIAFEASHLAADIFEVLNPCTYDNFDPEYEKYKKEHVNFDKLYIPIEYDKNFIDLLKYNREFIRQTNFKDWKQYDIVKYYSTLQRTKLFDITRELTKSFFRLVISQCAEFACVHGYWDGLGNEKPGNIIYTILELGSIYNAKRNENIRRQQSDPRYKLNNTGEIVGIEVRTEK